MLNKPILHLKRLDDFAGWDVWRQMNQKGMDCVLIVEKKGNKVIQKTVNCGISIENTTTFPGEVPQLFITLTGDEVALTDIRISC